jgi:hypothetical protein
MKKLIIIAILFLTAFYEPVAAQVKKVVVLNNRGAVHAKTNGNGIVRIHQDNGKHKGWYKQKHKKRVIVPGTLGHRTYVVVPSRKGNGKKH